MSSFFLTSKRLGFRWWTREDIELARRLWGDPAVTRLFSRLPLTTEQIEQRLNAELERAEKHHIQYWPMFELGTGKHIGCSGFRPYDLQNMIIELGFHLRPEFWGRGFATEAAKAVIDFATENIDYTAIFAGHHPENTGSRNVLLKLGFTETGGEFYEPTGFIHPSYLLKKES